MISFYRSMDGHEQRFYVDSDRPLTSEELEKLRRLIADPDRPEATRLTPFYLDSSDCTFSVAEIGPRLNFETPFSSNAVSICRAIGLTSVCRFEEAFRYPTDSMSAISKIIALHCDRMTQDVYSNGIASFETGLAPQHVRFVPILEDGSVALRAVNAELGLGFDDWDIDYYTALFRRYGRNPTDVEVFQIANANSEHCRHWYFKGRLAIDGVEMPECLLDLIREPLRRLENSNSVLAFNDNSGVIRGYKAKLLVPSRPGEPCSFTTVVREIDATGTAETHNHPTFVAPYPGGATGTGGRIRDNTAVGRGATPRVGVFGICVGNLHIPGFPIPGEVLGGEDLVKYASPLKILIEGSNGALNYGNEFGEPTIGGFTRSFGLTVGGERREFLKPILYTSGLGTIDHANAVKNEPEQGMLIVRIGGPAYRVGVGGGAASSMMQGANSAELDFKSVQRDNAEMGNRAVRVFRACVDMGDKNPIVATNDQGAGGPSNCLSELAGKLGGKIDIRQIVLGDKTMSVLEIWSAEFQEGYGILIRKSGKELLQSICKRERVNCEFVGEVTGDGRIVVFDSENDEKVVDLKLDDVLTGIPRKTFELKRIPRKLEPILLPHDLTVTDAFKAVLRLPQVGSKGFMVRKVDRSVTGLVAQQQCVGRAQIPIADVAVAADSYFGLTGAATAIGEQPNKLLIDPAAGTRMAVGEMLTNLCAARISRFEDISCRINWMWPAKLPGEGARMYDAAVALRDILISLGIKADGGKDSLSMAATVNGEIVKSPGQVVIMGYAPVPDITKIVTPDIKRPGESMLGLIDLGLGKNRLGGSSLAQAFGQIGNSTPDVDDPKLLKNTFLEVQKMIDDGLILAMHDRSDGGLITAVAEMCMASGCGFILTPNMASVIASLFSEELGYIIEIIPDGKEEDRVSEICNKYGIPFHFVGSTTNSTECVVRTVSTDMFKTSIQEIRQWWEQTSSRLEELQANPATVRQERESFAKSFALPEPIVTFDPKPTTLLRLVVGDKPKVAIIREEGTNGDREMAAAFFAGGLDPWDVTMSDLLEGRITLDQFQGVVFPGGFSFKDVLGSAKGWAAGIKFNDKLREMFDRFYDRPDTFSLGVCNGCQLMALLGWVPFKGLDEKSQPRFVGNSSGRFESRFAAIKVLPSPSVLLAGMEGSTLGVWVAHGEGRLIFPHPGIADEVVGQKLAPLAFVDPEGKAWTYEYPFNPNGSSMGLTALCSPNGRHLAMMPHPERCFLKWQWAWMPENLKKSLETSPWLRMFQNARTWCLKHRT